MDSLYEVSFELIRWLQGNYPGLADFMTFVSLLGEFEFYLAALPFIYWCLHKQFGRDLTYLLVLNSMLNNIFKHLTRLPRPYWVEPDLGLSQSIGFGFPSGHAQNVTLIFGVLASWVRRGWLWILAVLLILLMSLSRVYLGVHFVHDVLGGLLAGLLLLGGYLVWERFFRQSFRNRILGQRLLVVILVPLAILLIYVVSLLLLPPVDEQVVWAAYIPVAEAELIESMTNLAAILIGLGVGFVLEASRVHFIVAAPWLHRILRYLLGTIVTIALWRGLDLVFPEEPLWLALPFRFFRYFLMSIWTAYYAPAVFVRLGLAQASPEPDVQITVRTDSIMRR